MKRSASSSPDLKTSAGIPGNGDLRTAPPLTTYPGVSTGIPPSLPWPPDPYRNLGYRIGGYVRSIFGSDLEALCATMYGKADKEEKYLAEGIAIGSGTIPRLCQNGDGEVCELRCIFTAGAKRIVIIPRPLQIPGEVLRDRQLYEDFAGWLLAREDGDLFEVRFG
jgi:hypothetical protein